MNRASVFGRFSKWAAHKTGHPLAFLVAAGLIVVWLALGPVFKFGDTWQLAVNTITSIVTFLMVFLIQHTQNKDTAAMQVKLDELIRATHGAHNALLDLEELEEHELEAVRANYRRLAGAARDDVRCGKPDTESPDVGIGGNPDRA